jgi:hypothetical protein
VREKNYQPGPDMAQLLADAVGGIWEGGKAVPFGSGPSVNDAFGWFHPLMKKCMPNKITSVMNHTITQLRQS